MNKTKFITIIAVGLFIANLVLCTFLIMGKLHNDRMRVNPKEVVIKTLQFDEAQVKAYDKIIKTHQNAVNAEQEKIQVLKKNLYQSLANEAMTTAKDSLIKEISLTYLAIENTNYQHFAALKKLCKPEQMTNYSTLMDRIAEVFNFNKNEKTRPLH